MLILGSALSLSLTFAVAAPARLCEPSWPGPEATVEMVGEATFIARARALAPDTLGRRGTPVRFEIEEVLKRGATTPPAVIALRGYTVDRDDFNKQPVPYTYVRPSGLRGSCFADEYRAGADYLLLLVETKPGEFDSHWAPLLPVNEQLHGVDDPWLAWVRSHTAARRGS